MKLTGPLAVLLAALMWPVATAASDPLEGRWLVNGDGATVDIVPTAGTDGLMSMIYVEGPDLSVEPGTEVATITRGGTPGVYDCHALLDPRGKARGARQGSVTFAIRFMEGSADVLDFQYYNNKMRVSLWRWIPYLFRVAIIQSPDKPAYLDGARRADSHPWFVVL